MSVESEIEGFLRLRLAEKLKQCTEAQRVRFHELFPEVPAKILKSAVALVDRTIAANAKDAEKQAT